MKNSPFFFHDLISRYFFSSIFVFSRISSAIALHVFTGIPAALPTATNSFIPGFLPFPSTVVVCLPKWVVLHVRS